MPWVEDFLKINKRGETSIKYLRVLCPVILVGFCNLEQLVFRLMKFFIVFSNTNSNTNYYGNLLLLLSSLYLLHITQTCI